MKEAKHPVLLLRKLDNVVGSDIDIGAGKNQGLVLTGPNSGGKTVILKLMGLCALMARDGIPVPAQSKGARVDFFNPVFADKITFTDLTVFLWVDGVLFPTLPSLDNHVQCYWLCLKVSFISWNILFL